MAAQIIHAAGESSTGDLPPGTYAVALAARDELQLHKIEKKLKKHNIPHVVIREPDPPWCGAMMAIGLLPGPRDSVRKGVSRLPLIE